MRVFKWFSVFALAFVAGCSPLSSNPSPTAEPMPVVTVSITIEEGHDLHNVKRPTRVDVIMAPTGDPVQRCEDMGGKVVSVGGRIVCEDVDY